MPVKRRRWTAPSGQKKESWKADFYDEAGARHRRSGFSTKRDAEEWERLEMARLVAEARQAGLPAEERRRLAAAGMTVAELARSWLDACKHGLDGSPPVEARTYADYEGSVRLHILPRIGTTAVTAIDGPVLSGLRERLLREVSRVKAQRVLRHMRQMLNHAVKRGYLTASPGSAVRIKRDARVMRVLRMPSHQEFDALLKAIYRKRNHAQAEGERCRRERPLDNRAGVRFDAVAQSWRCFALLMQTAACTGLRISELLALCWTDFSLDGHPTLRVERRADQRGSLGDPKSAAARRTVVLPSALAAAFSAWRAECPAGDLGLVFPSPEGKVQQYPNVHRRLLRPALAEAGLVGPKGELPFAFHGSRHYHASALIAEDLNVKEVSAQLGHSDATLTLNTYGHLFDAELEKRRLAVERAHARLGTSELKAPVLARDEPPASQGAGSGVLRIYCRRK